jgi:hypothetical protein
MNLLLRNRYWIFLTILSLAVIVLGATATFTYGAGMAGDSAKYVGVAQKILEGKGLIDHREMPLLSWPPLYPIVIALLGWLTRLDVFVAAWYFNLFLLGLNLFLSGVIFQQVFKTKLLYAYLASLFVFLSGSSLKIHDVISSDPFYLTITLLFLLALNSYVKTKSYGVFAWIVLLSALAPLQRYVGIVMPLTALIIIVLENRRSFRIFVREGLLLVFISLLPIAWWLVIHNLVMNGSLWGIGPAITDVGENIRQAFVKMLHWFVPYLSFLMPVLSKPWVVLGFVALLLIWINRKQPVFDLLRSKRSEIRAAYPTLLHALVYFTAVAYTISTPDHRSLYSDRYYVILLVPVIILVLFIFDWFIRPHLRFSARQVDLGLVVFVLIWSLYPIYGLREYLLESLSQGEASEYNFINTKSYHENNIVLKAQEIAQANPDAIFYSNFFDIVWFYTRKNTYIPPDAAIPNPEQELAGWPYTDQGAYVVWFEPYEYGFYMGPDQLSKFANLRLIVNNRKGEIYLATPR